MRWVVLLMGTILLSGCAQIEPPPGGPVDLVAPFVEDHYPPAGATGVSTQAEIAITFSENMNRSTVEEALFISPTPTQPPEMKWRGGTLRIRPREVLKADLTYVFTLGVGCKDLHNNGMKSSYSFAFSTGQIIDNGVIRGRVYQDFSPRKGVDLWAYQLSVMEQPNPSSDDPQYITQTDEQGGFELNHLGRGSYRVFAVEDGNKDRRLEPEEELVGVPSLDVSLTPEIASMTMSPIGLVLLDSVGPSLESAQVLNSRTVMLSFDENLDSTLAVEPRWYHISVAADTLDTLRIQAVSPVWRHPHQIILYTDPQESGTDYRATVSGLTDVTGKPLQPLKHLARFVGTDQPDTCGPKLVDIQPADSIDNVSPRTHIFLRFDEAVDPTSLEKALLLTDTTTTIEGQIDFLHAAAALFRPHQLLKYGQWYTISLDGARVQDLAGNVMGDSVIVVRFGTMAEEMLGSISGVVKRGAHPLEAVAVVLAFGPRDDVRLTRQAVIQEDYHLRHLLPGRYTLGAFLDLDGDGRWDSGRPVPFRPSEPLWMVQDTVTVRSRWETAEVEISFER